jgi:hypothetical protein
VRAQGQLLLSTQMGGLAWPMAAQQLEPPPKADLQACWQGQVVHPVAGAYFSHEPPTHTSSLPQASPQSPQWKMSVLVLTQATRPLGNVSHALSPPVQSFTQAPFWQPWSPSQVAAQEPQWSGLFERSTHWPLHDVRPGLQVQAPSLQNSALLQVLPQPPQCLGSFFTSRHVPLHSTVPAAHTQEPPAHASTSGLQPLPQLPQCFGSVWRSVHAPPHDTPGEGHEQAPETHTPLGPQLAPHAPQLAGSEERSAQPPGQITLPAPVQAHWPLTHEEAVPQDFPQAPQLFASVARLAQVWPQSTSLGAQVPGPVPAAPALAPPAPALAPPVPGDEPPAPGDEPPVAGDEPPVLDEPLDAAVPAAPAVPPVLVAPPMPGELEAAPAAPAADVAPAWPPPPAAPAAAPPVPWGPGPSPSRNSAVSAPPHLAVASRKPRSASHVEEERKNPVLRIRASRPKQSTVASRGG